MLLQVDEKVGFAEELLLTELALEHRILCFLVKVVLRLRQRGGARPASLHCVIVIIVVIVFLVVLLQGRGTGDA